MGVNSIVISTQHDDFTVEKYYNLDIFRQDIVKLVSKFIKKTFQSDYERLFSKTKFIINPAGSFVIGGPHGDTGLTGRKIIVDTYGGKGSHGGGAFSGKFNKSR